MVSVQTWCAFQGPWIMTLQDLVMISRQIEVLAKPHLFHQFGSFFRIPSKPKPQNISYLVLPCGFRSILVNQISHPKQDWWPIKPWRKRSSHWELRRIWCPGTWTNILGTWRSEDLWIHGSWWKPGGFWVDFVWWLFWKEAWKAMSLRGSYCWWKKSCTS